MLQESFGLISINNFSAPLADFWALEPDYTPAPNGCLRYWNYDVAYLSDGANQTADPFFTPERLAYYEGREQAYFLAMEAAENSTLFVHCTISGGEPGHLYPFVEQGKTGLDFHFEIRNAAGQVCEWLSGKWGIMIHFLGERRQAKVKSVMLHQGIGDMRGYNDNKNTGDFEILESTFAPVTLPDGRVFKFRLAQPIIFTISEA